MTMRVLVILCVLCMFIVMLQPASAISTTLTSQVVVGTPIYVKINGITVAKLTKKGVKANIYYESNETFSSVIVDVTGNTGNKATLSLPTAVNVIRGYCEITDIELGPQQTYFIKTLVNITSWSCNITRNVTFTFKDNETGVSLNDVNLLISGGYNFSGVVNSGYKITVPYESNLIITASKLGYWGIKNESITVTQNLNLVILFHKQACFIEGYIRNEEGKFVNATVNITQLGETYTVKGFHYTLYQSLPLGKKVTVTASAKGYYDSTVSFTPTKGGVYLVNLTLVNKTKIGGVVYNAFTLNPVSGAIVHISNKTFNETEKTNKWGYFKAPKGTYNVTVNKENYVTYTNTLTFGSNNSPSIPLMPLYTLKIFAKSKENLWAFKVKVTNLKTGEKIYKNASMDFVLLNLKPGMYLIEVYKNNLYGNTIVYLTKNTNVTVNCTETESKTSNVISYAPIHVTTLHFFINGAPASNTPITISYKNKESTLNTDNTGKLTYYVNSTIPVTISFSGVKRTIYLPRNNYYIYLWNINVTILDESTGLKFNESIPVTIFYNMEELASYIVQGCKPISFITIETHPKYPEIYFRTPLRQVAVHKPTKTVIIYYPKNAIKVKLNIIDNIGHFYGGDIVIRRGNKVIDVEKLEQNKVLYLLRGVNYEVYVSTKDGNEMRDIGFFTASNRTVTLTIGGLNLPSFKNEFTYSIYRKNNNIIVEYSNAKSVSLEVTSGKTIVYRTTSKAKSGAFVVPVNNTSEVVTLIANTSSGNITVSKYFGKKQSILFPIFGKKSWIYNLVAIGIVIVTLLLFGEYRTDVGCVLAVAMAAMLWYWGWLQVSPFVISVCAIIAGAAVVTVTRRLGI